MTIYQSHKIGPSEFDNIAFMQYVLAYEYDYDDIPGGLEIDYAVDPQTFILGVGHLVTEEFSGSSTVTLEIGDGTDPNEHVSTADLDLTTLDNFYRSTGGSEDASGGVYDTDAQQVTLTFNQAPTAGAGTLLLWLMRIDTNWRVP